VGEDMWHGLKPPCKASDLGPAVVLQHPVGPLLVGGQSAESPQDVRKQLRLFIDVQHVLAGQPTSAKPCQQLPSERAYKETKSS
jgi:hypothetical protein